MSPPVVGKTRCLVNSLDEDSRHAGRCIDLSVVSNERIVSAHNVGARLHDMAFDVPPQTLGRDAQCCHELAGGIVSFDGVGNSISAQNVAAASLRASMENDLGSGNRT